MTTCPYSVCVCVCGLVYVRVYVSRKKCMDESTVKTFTLYKLFMPVLPAWNSQLPTFCDSLYQFLEYIVSIWIHMATLIPYQIHSRISSRIVSYCYGSSVGTLCISAGVCAQRDSQLWVSSSLPWQQHTKQAWLQTQHEVTSILTEPL